MEAPSKPEKQSRLGVIKDAVLIIVSVALGYLAAQYAEYRQGRELAAQALTAIRQELIDNQAILEPLHPIHQQRSQALNDVADPNGKSWVQVLFETRPSLPKDSPSPFPFLRRSAWDAAVAGGALPLLDFELVTALSDQYRVQEIAVENISR